MTFGDTPAIALLLALAISAGHVATKGIANFAHFNAHEGAEK